MENNTLDIWKDLIEEHDLKLFREFQTKTKSDIEDIRSDWKLIRIYALDKLNKDLHKSGQLLNIDVSDDELYPYVGDNNVRFLFFKYSRILDFNDGYLPKNFILIKKF